MGEMTKREISMMMAGTFADPWLNIAVHSGRQILISGDDDHEPTVRAYADVLGFSFAQTTDLLRMIRNRETDRFLASCAEWRTGDDLREDIAADRAAAALYGGNEH